MKHPAPTRSPREQMTLDLIEEALLHLMASGKPPNVTNVRALLGGSPNTIHPLIARWFKERAPTLLDGRISVVQGSDLPDAVHALVAELRADARLAAEQALAQRVAEAEVIAAEAKEASRIAKEREDSANRRSEELDALLPALRADIELARAETAAARGAANTAAQERREAIAAREAADELLRSAETRATQFEERLSLANASCQISRSETKEALKLLAEAKLTLEVKQAEIERASAEATASIAALRSSIDEIKAAHFREVQAMRATQAEAASRWAGEKASLQKKLDTAEAARSLAEQAATDIADHLKQAQGKIVEQAVGIERLLADQASLFERLTVAEREVASQRSAASSDLARRLERIETALAGAETHERNQCNSATTIGEASLPTASGRL